MIKKNQNHRLKLKLIGSANEVMDKIKTPMLIKFEGENFQNSGVRFKRGFQCIMVNNWSKVV